MRELGDYISKDMLQAVTYIPLGILTGVIWLAAVQFFSKTVWKWNQTAEPPADRERKTIWAWFFIIVYVTVLLELAFFSREPGSRTGIDLGLFETWGTTMRSHSYFIENIAMFIPFGILFPMGFRILRKGTYCVAAGFAFSTCLELAQLITSRGYCQLDDVLTNTVGAWIGWLIFQAAAERGSSFGK
ncbi:MAG: VanZ family protein [Lachnospiraceae bacterium]|nr:VanZ family protein [Lachnospiraceae bacterium]